jgi:ankyrin repeat protein
MAAVAEAAGPERPAGGGDLWQSESHRYTSTTDSPREPRGDDAPAAAAPVQRISALPPEVCSAVEAGEVGSVGEWLAAGGDANARDSTGLTLLMVAASSSNVEAVRLALAHSANPDLQQPQGMTALMYASMSGHIKLVNLLLSAHARLDTRDNRGFTAHDHASIKGHYLVSCVMLQHSVRHGHLECSSNDDTSRESRDASRDPPISHPRSGRSVESRAGAGQAGAGEATVSAGSDEAGCANGDGGAAPAAAARSGSPAATPLPLSMHSTHPGAAQQQPKSAAGAPPASAAPAAAADARPRLPARLLESVRNGDSAAVQAYLDSGGDVDAVDEEMGGTMLMTAASAGHEALAGLLLHAGASVDFRDGNGCTALATACFSQHDGMVVLLLRAGAALNNQDLLGLTALMVAALSGATSIIRLLLMAGAATDLRDMAGRTAYDYAQFNGHLGARKLLRAHRMGRAHRIRAEAAAAIMTVEEGQQANARMQGELAGEAGRAAADGVDGEGGAEAACGERVSAQSASGERGSAETGEAADAATGERAAHVEAGDRAAAQRLAPKARKGGRDRQGEVHVGRQWDGPAGRQNEAQLRRDASRYAAAASSACSRRSGGSTGGGPPRTSTGRPDPSFRGNDAYFRVADAYFRANASFRPDASLRASSSSLPSDTSSFRSDPSVRGGDFFRAVEASFRNGDAYFRTDTSCRNGDACFRLDSSYAADVSQGGDASQDSRADDCTLGSASGGVGRLSNPGSVSGRGADVSQRGWAGGAGGGAGGGGGWFASAGAPPAGAGGLPACALRPHFHGGGGSSPPTPGSCAGLGQVWGGYDSPADSSHDLSTHDASFFTWAGEPDPDASNASLASSVACSALDEQSAAGEEPTPTVLICPLTGEMMRDPVSTVDGQVYDRHAIAAWLETHDTAPLTGETLPMKLLVPSLPLRAMLHEIQERKKLRQVNASAAAMLGIDTYRAAPPAVRFRAPPPPAPALLVPAPLVAGASSSHRSSREEPSFRCRW